LYRGREHASIRAGWPLIGAAVLVLALVGAAVWFFFLREGAPLGGGGREAPPFAFDLRNVSSVAVDGKAPKETLDRAARGVGATLNAMYSAGFVDPDKWEGGTFPEVLEAFGSQAATVAEGDLPDLTLGPTSSAVDFVKPERSRLDVQFLLGQTKKPFAAVATTTFRATGELNDGRHLLITHRGRYIMQRIDGVWLIVSYEVDGKLRPAKPQPEGSP
jgi:hypothetical protein